MSRPIVPAVTESWYDELSVAEPGDDQRDWALLILLGAFGVAFGRVHDIVRDSDTRDGWSIVLDPDATADEDLPWLAQFAGVQLDPALSVADQRAAIVDHPRFERGTPAALLEDLKATLTGAKQVTMYERELNPYRVVVITYTAQTPDPAGSLAAVLAQKPAGVLLSQRVYNGQNWRQLAANEATWADVASDYASWTDVETDMTHVPL